MLALALVLVATGDDGWREMDMTRTGLELHLHSATMKLEVVASRCLCSQLGMMDLLTVLLTTIHYRNSTTASRCRVVCCAGQLLLRNIAVLDCICIIRSFSSSA